ncbi:hypothetical protein B0H13DRAFT_1881604 [Mycena leptocephala]|nr:hypothetical protein B0H13DRAFT_1881604 [Mycena leptocephala]
MSNETVDSLNLPLLQQVPDPFFTEYATHYRVNVRADGVKLEDRAIAMRVIFAGGRGNPPTIPLLATHAAKFIDGVLHFKRRCTAKPEATGAFPVEYLPGPEDEYFEEEGASSRMRKQKQKQRKMEKAKLVMMDFVFPPLGRRVSEPTSEELDDERAGRARVLRHPLPRDFLGAMIEDLKRESAEAAEAVSEAEEALKEALYAYECARMEAQEERMAWKRLWPDIERVAGKEATEDCVARAAMRVKDEIPPDEDEAESVVEEEDSQWKSRVTEPDLATASPPAPRSPAPVPRAPAPAAIVLQPLLPPINLNTQTFGGNATPAPAAPAASVMPPLLPPITLNMKTFGGTATSFDRGPFLKRRREDVDSDSESDGSDSGSTHKRRAPSPGLTTASLPPLPQRQLTQHYRIPQGELRVSSESSARSQGRSILPSPPKGTRSPESRYPLVDATGIRLHLRDRR